LNNRRCTAYYLNHKEEGIGQLRLIGQKSAASLMAELSLPYNGSSGSSADVEPTEAEVKKKECKFLRWWRDIWS
jgi:hypothetical protein